MIKGKRIIVTGGSGFLGSWLCDGLVKKGCEVICIDNFSSGNKRNIVHLLSNPKFKLIKHDIVKPLQINGQIDYIFHLASRASPADFEEYSIDILLANSLGTYNMLKLARGKNARFLLASSSEIYGDPGVHPQPEDYWGNVNPIGSRSCYDEGKRFSESLSVNFHRRYDLDVRIARIFNTYGPRMRPHDGRVISNFIVQALKDRPITVYGDGSQTRTFCYVSDMVDGLIKLMFANGLKCRIINLGSPNEITILEVAKLIKKCTFSNSRIMFKPLPRDDPKRRTPDLSKARNFPHWRPKISLDKGLSTTIKYFRKTGVKPES